MLSGTTLHTTTAIAQTNSPPSKPPVAIAVETDVIPKLDGEVLKDPAWDSAKIFSSFCLNHNASITIPFSALAGNACLANPP